jgi:hypothetical protein
MGDNHARRPMLATTSSTPTRPAVPGGLAWERRANESGAAWQAFQTYRDLGVLRSQRKAFEKLGKSRTVIEHWARDHDWNERVAAFDQAQDRARLEAEMTKLAQVNRSFAAEAKAVRSEEIGVGRALIAKAREMLEFPLTTQKVSLDGKSIIIMPTQWTPANAARMAEVGSDLVRRGVGLPTQLPAVPVNPDGTPVPPPDPNAARHVFINIFEPPGLRSPSGSTARPVLAASAAAVPLAEPVPPSPGGGNGDGDGDGDGNGEHDSA